MKWLARNQEKKIEVTHYSLLYQEFKELDF